MGQNNDAAIASAGLVDDFFSKLRADVIDIGGNDERMFAPNKGGDPRVVRKMAETIVGIARMRSLEWMLSDSGLRSDRVDSDITEQHFPLDKEGAYDDSGLGLFGPSREWTTAEAEVYIKPGGGHLEGLVRGLAYLKAHPHMLKYGPIVFAASIWIGPVNVPLVPCAVPDDGGPRLVIKCGGRDDRWPWHYRCLFSR